MQRRRQSLVGGWLAGIVVAGIVSVWTGGAAVAAEASWTHWFADGSLDGFTIVSGTATYEIRVFSRICG